LIFYFFDIILSLGGCIPVEIEITGISKESKLDENRKQKTENPFQFFQISI